MRLSSHRAHRSVPDIVKDLTEAYELRRRAGVAEQMEVCAPLENTRLQQRPVMQFQTTCIRCLIEMKNSLLEGMDLKGEALIHGQLNKALEKILFCNEYKATIGCMTDYVRLLATGLERTDESSWGRGVIREIQLFIRQNYSKNITLNMLAEQFYLHP